MRRSTADRRVPSAPRIYLLGGPGKWVQVPVIIGSCHMLHFPRAVCLEGPGNLIDGCVCLVDPMRVLVPSRRLTAYQGARRPRFWHQGWTLAILSLSKSPVAAVAPNEAEQGAVSVPLRDETVRRCSDPRGENGPSDWKRGGVGGRLEEDKTLVIS